MTTGEASVGSGVPPTFGGPQRAADLEASLFRGHGVHAADTVIDHGAYGALTVRAASVRGTYGRYHGTPREDDYALDHSDDGRWLIVAVADGVTSATASHLAATLAVRTAAQQTRRALEQTADVGDVDLHGVFQSAAYQLRRNAEPLLAAQGAEPTVDRLAGLFATTLLLAIVPTTVAPGHPVRLARVGDSNGWLLSPSPGWTPLLPVKAGRTEPASSSVAALPRLPAELEEAAARPSPGDTLVLATDGVTDPFGPSLDGEVARFLHRRWHAGLPPPLEFARQLSFRGQSWDDDRTAVAIAGW